MAFISNGQHLTLRLHKNLPTSFPRSYVIPPPRDPTSSLLPLLLLLPMIGIDLLHLPRLSAVLLRQNSRYVTRFARRILTTAEFAVFQTKLQDTEVKSQFEWGSEGEKSPLVRWLGTRWAAKEAAFKAGGLGRQLLWKDIEVRYYDSGQPYLFLVDGEGTGQLSISHDGDYVVAMAFIPPAPVMERGFARVGLGMG